MGAYPIGGGGGRIRVPEENTDSALSKPYDMRGDWSGLKSDQLDEMLETLFRSSRQTQEIVQIIENDGGDVVGPSSAVDDRIATFDGTTGKLIQDGGYSISDIATILISGVSFASVSRTFTNDELKSLNTVPITIVSGVANKILIPLWGVWHNNQVAGYSTSQNVNIFHATVASIQSLMLFSIGVTGGIAINRYTYSGAVVAFDDLSVNNPVGDPLIIRSGGDVTSGNASNYAKLYLIYMIVNDIP